MNVREVFTVRSVVFLERVSMGKERKRRTFHVVRRHRVQMQQEPVKLTTTITTTTRRCSALRTGWREDGRISAGERFLFWKSTNRQFQIGPDREAGRTILAYGMTYIMHK